MVSAGLTWMSMTSDSNACGFIIFPSTPLLFVRVNCIYFKFLSGIAIIKDHVAHTKTGSIKHNVGDTDRAGDYIAAVGHSGNSSVPHLHFQLMNRVDIKSAKGLPCCFSSHETNINDLWEKVECGIPGSK